MDPRFRQILQGRFNLKVSTDGGSRENGSLGIAMCKFGEELGIKFSHDLDIAGKLMSESSAISLSERINFLAHILTSMQETAFLGVQQSLAKGFTSNKDFGEATDRIAKIRNKVDLLQARIKELEL